MTTTLPPQFLGKFKLDRSEKFDEYLASKEYMFKTHSGVNWILRKMISLSSITKVFEKGSEEGLYNMKNLSSKENTSYENWKLGENFEGKGLDGKQHKITFDLVDNEVLTECHIRLDNQDEPAETYRYTIENGELVLKLENAAVTCRRFFKKID